MGLPAKVGPQQLERRLSAALGFFNEVENTADSIVELLAQMSDEDVLETRRYARALGYVGWRLEVIADAEILKRIQSRQGQRGNEGDGKMAAYCRAAETAGCHEDTIRRNIQIYKTFLAPDVPELVLSAQQKLREKGYCEAALRADNPHEALIEFDRRKQEDFRFNTREAHKVARAGDVEKERKRILPAVAKVLLEPDKQALWEKWLKLTGAVQRGIPDLSRILAEAIKTCREQLSLPEQTVEERLMFFLREGPGPTCEQLADQLQMDRFKVQGILDKLVEEDALRAVKQSDDKTKITSARGATPLLYFVNQPVIGEGDRGMYFTDADDDD